jgi:hypothetical protein
MVLRLYMRMFEINTTNLTIIKYNSFSAPFIFMMRRKKKFLRILNGQFGLLLFCMIFFKREILI